MAVYAKINSNADIINGSAVSQPVGSGYILDNTQRDLHFTSLTNTELGIVMDEKYHTGSSGGWERPWGPIQ